MLLAARVQSSLRHFGQAWLAALHAARLQPGQPEVYYVLGQLCVSQGRPTEAIGYLRAATSLARDDLASASVTAAWYTLGECLQQTGYLLAAAEAFEHFDRDLWETAPRLRTDAEIAPILAHHPYGAVGRRIELLRTLDRTADCVAVAECGRSKADPMRCTYSACTHRRCWQPTSRLRRSNTAGSGWKTRPVPPMTVVASRC